MDISCWRRSPTPPGKPAGVESDRRRRREALYRAACAIKEKKRVCWCQASVAPRSARARARLQPLRRRHDGGAERVPRSRYPQALNLAKRVGAVDCARLCATPEKIDRVISACFVLGLSVREGQLGAAAVARAADYPAAVSTLAKRLDDVVATFHAAPQGSIPAVAPTGWPVFAATKPPASPAQFVLAFTVGARGISTSVPHMAIRNCWALQPSKCRYRRRIRIVQSRCAECCRALACTCPRSDFPTVPLPP